MKVLVLNCGSSSLKYQLINMQNEEVLASGKYERIGEAEAFIVHKAGSKKIEIKNPAYNHKEAIDFTLKQLTNPEYKVIDSLEEIEAIGHRAVHGGEEFTSSCVITNEVLAKLEELVDLAPLHNPAVILGIKACMEIAKDVPMVAVFDTAFHQTIKKDKYMYPIPTKYYKEFKIRKYGFHGTSHKFVAQRYSELTGKKEAKLITCHLGQGGSICAIENGKSVDTTMGFTPLGGISMVTRSGDLDPSVVLNIMKKEKITAEEMEDILNKKSGVHALANQVPDFREIELSAVAGNEEGKIAIENFNYTIAGFVAKYAAALYGADAIIFTGGIGENQINIRRGICEKLTFMGVEIDNDLNNTREESKISKESSKVEVYVIPTNEELMIAKETVELI